MIFSYVRIQDYFTGYLGYEHQSAWNLYGRVATFVNCSTFTPPRGTRFLCPPEPLGHRLPQAYYLYASTAPAVERFGAPFEAPPYANALLRSFSVAAIEHEPLAYAEAIVRGLGFYVFPRNGEGDTPQGVREAVMDAGYERTAQPDFTGFFPESLGYSGPASNLRRLTEYESYTRIQGPLLILLLAAAIAGPFFLPARMRWAAALITP